MTRCADTAGSGGPGTGLIGKARVARPGAAGATNAASSEARKVDADLAERGDDVFAIPLESIDSVEPFKQGFNQLIRVHVAALASDALIFGISGGASGMSGSKRDDRKGGHKEPDRC